MDKIIYMFKATRDTNRFRENQKVWILYSDNYFDIKFKWRGRGRWVRGRIDKFSKIVGEVKEITVTEEFYNRLYAR